MQNPHHRADGFLLALVRGETLYFCKLGPSEIRFSTWQFKDKLLSHLALNRLIIFNLIRLARVLTVFLLPPNLSANHPRGYLANKGGMHRSGLEGRIFLGAGGVHPGMCAPNLKPDINWGLKRMAGVGVLTNQTDSDTVIHSACQP